MSGASAAEGDAAPSRSPASSESGHSSADLTGFEGVLPPQYDPKAGPLEVRVDHKSGFSAERTFVVWFHLAVVIAMVALGAVSMGGSASMHFAGQLLALPALFFVVWPTLQLRRRQQALRAQKDDGLRDDTGPFLAVLTMCLVVTFNLAKAWRHWWVEGVEAFEDGP